MRTGPGPAIMRHGFIDYQPGNGKIMLPLTSDQGFYVRHRCRNEIDGLSFMELGAFSAGVPRQSVTGDRANPPPHKW